MSRFWPFKKRESVQEYVERRMKEILTAETLGMQEEQAHSHFPKERPWDEKTAALASALLEFNQRVSSYFFESVQKAQKAEKDGDIEKAIEIYEELARSHFKSNLPYERLRIIYRKQKKHDEALRICQLAVDNPYLEDAKKKHFQAWVEKMT